MEEVGGSNPPEPIAEWICVACCGLWAATTSIPTIVRTYPYIDRAVVCMQGVAVADERGRVTLGHEVTERFGREFHVVVLPREVVLIPVPKEPLKDLREMGKKIPEHLSLKDFKRIAEEEAMKEAMGNWKRLQKLRKGKRR